MARREGLSRIVERRSRAGAVAHSITAVCGASAPGSVNAPETVTVSPCRIISSLGASRVTTGAASTTEIGVVNTPCALLSSMTVAVILNRPWRPAKLGSKY